jgi:hypothetical protein
MASRKVARKAKRPSAKRTVKGKSHTASPTARAISEARKAYPGWTVSASPTRSPADAGSSSSADAISKSLGELKRGLFGADADAAGPPPAPRGKSDAKTVIARSGGQEKKITVIRGKISSVQG